MKELKKNLHFAWKYAKYQKKNLFFLIFCNFLSIVISVIVPIFSAKIIVKLTANELYQVIMISLIILLIELTSNVVHYFRRNLSSVVYRETFKKIQIFKDLLMILEKLLIFLILLIWI